MNKIVIFVTVAGVTACLFLPTSAIANPDVATDEASFAIFGNLPISGGQEFGNEDLIKIGVNPTRVDDLMSKQSPVSPDIISPASNNSLPAAPVSDSLAPEALLAPDLAAGDPRYDVLNQWKEKEGKTVFLRRGYWTGISPTGSGYGFGYEKLSNYHNLNTSALKAVTIYPRPVGGIIFKGGTKYNYETEVSHVTCSGWFIFRKCRDICGR
jgi:hypothetical protein